MRLVPESKLNGLAGHFGHLRKRQLMVYAIIKIAEGRGCLASRLPFIDGEVNQFGDRFQKTLAAAASQHFFCVYFLKASFRPQHTVKDHRLGLVKLMDGEISIAWEKHDVREVENPLALIDNRGTQ